MADSVGKSVESEAVNRWVPILIPIPVREAERPVWGGQDIANVLGIAVIPFLQRAPGNTTSAIGFCGGVQVRRLTCTASRPCETNAPSRFTEPRAKLVAGWTWFRRGEVNDQASRYRLADIGVVSQNS